MKFKALWLTFMALSFSSSMAKKEVSPQEEQPEKLGEFGNWQAFVSQEGGKKVCYMLSFPTSQEGNYKKRGKPYIMITHRPEDESLNVVSLHAGYKYAKDHKPLVLISIGKEKKEYEMFVEGESAWAPSDDIDSEITKLIIKTATRVAVKGESFKGTKSTDIYSLKGSLAAYNVICQACKVKPS